MIEVHDPVRILFIVEHFPEVVLQTIQRAPETYEWFVNDWVKLTVINPETHELFVFADGEFVHYEPLEGKVAAIEDVAPLVESHQENIPVHLLTV